LTDSSAFNPPKTPCPFHAVRQKDFADSALNVDYHFLFLWLALGETLGLWFLLSDFHKIGDCLNNGIKQSTLEDCLV
jgi:hypothetical protein